MYVLQIWLITPCYLQNAWYTITVWCTSINEIFWSRMGEHIIHLQLAYPSCGVRAQTLYLLYSCTVKCNDQTVWTNGGPTLGHHLHCCTKDVLYYIERPWLYHHIATIFGHWHWHCNNNEVASFTWPIIQWVCRLQVGTYLANTRHCINVGLMFPQRRRRWADNETALVEGLIFAEIGSKQS